MSAQSGVSWSGLRSPIGGEPAGIAKVANGFNGSEWRGVRAVSASRLCIVPGVPTSLFETDVEFWLDHRRDDRLREVVGTRSFPTVSSVNEFERIGQQMPGVVGPWGEHHLIGVAKFH